MSDPGDELWDQDDYPPNFGEDYDRRFCEIKTVGERSECARCGSVNYVGQVPTCPPWVTRSEPNNDRLPHITSREQNHAAYQTWLEEQWKRRPLPTKRRQI